ncbi:colicin E3/pyocin S6 family cytotoxin [Erwinia sorbitola]|nr:colicin E3/pyocin S6 family cytotoxin [Erwinia sorbitola]
MTDVEGAERIPVAGTLDSVSGCPCRSGFIVTHYPAMKYESRSSGLTSSGGSPAVYGSMAGSGSALSSVAANAAKNVKTPVFAKSCLRGEGCNDAGQESEPHTNFARMAFYQAIPPADPASNYDVPQHAQSARKKKPAEDIPKPKKRSALYKWWFSNYEEVEYQRAAAAAASAANAQSALEGASVLGLIGGSAITSGTWAVSSATRLGAIAASGPGAPIAALLVGMMPGRLNEGEQDFIDRLRLEQMHEAPSRVRYTWENDSNSDAVPHGWHTPPGKDMVRVRKMEWDSSRNAYTFITEEEPRITIIWTPDSSGVNVASNTGNQNPVWIPNPVVVDPLPEDTRIEATTTPAPEEKNFADYILILPIADIPPIYIYWSKPRNGLPQNGHDYHPAPDTSEITGISGLSEAKPKTPKQGGGGKRERWIDAKGRRVYEWDSQHGELETYRASDGEHLGSVDYKTGEQLKPAVKGRNIKRYL